MRKCPNLSIWVTLAMLQLSKFRRNFGNSDRNPVKFLLPKLVFSESFLTVQLSRCAFALLKKESMWVAVDSNHRPPAYQAGALTD